MDRRGGPSLIGRAAILGVVAALVAMPSLARPQAGSRGLADAPVSRDAVDDGFRPRRVALVIGIDEYDDPRFPTLRYSRADAEAMGALLDDPMWSGFDEVVVLTAPERTSRVEILAALDDLSLSLHRNDTFLLYFSGHGTLSTERSGSSSVYICPRDAIHDRPASTSISVETLQHVFKRLPCRRKVLILDSCHNGEAKSFLDDRTREALSRRRSPLDPRIADRVSEAEAHLFAAALHQPALEDPDLQHGVYTFFLLQALGERSLDADLDGDGVVTVVEAHEYARDHTIAHTGGSQVPQAMFREVGREDIFLTGTEDALLAAESGLLTSYSRLLAECRLRVDGTPRGVLPRTVPVAPGLHRIEVVEPRSGRLLVQRTVHVAAGRSLSVDALADERRAERLWSVAGGVGAVGVVGPYASSYPRLSLGPDISFRTRFRGAIRDVRLSFDLGWAHGEGAYRAAYDLPVRADLLRAGVGLQACHDTGRLNGWFGSRLHVVGVVVDDEIGPSQFALMPSAGLVGGLDIWGQGPAGMQLALSADVFTPIVEDLMGTKEMRLGVFVGGQLRVLGVLR